MACGIFRPVATTLIVATIAGLLPGCVTFDQRGGMVSYVEDSVLFQSNTKSHRLFRSYVLIGALASVAKNAGMSDVEKASVGGRLNAALSVAYETYQCLYPQRVGTDWLHPKPAPNPSVAQKPTPCVMFDERMARLDYALYKLAADVMLDPDSQTLFADVRDRLIGNIPVLGSAVRTASLALNTTEAAVGTVHETLSLANSIVRLSVRASGRYAYLGSIYRDVLELDMRVVLDSLHRECLEQEEAARQQGYKICANFISEGDDLFGSGEGLRLDEWRTYMRGVIEADRARVQAYPAHFSFVSRWLFNSCAVLFTGDVLKPGKVRPTDASFDASVKVVMNTLNDKCSPLIEFFAPEGDQTMVYHRGPDDDQVITVMRRVPSRPRTAISSAAAKARGEALPADAKPGQAPAAQPGKGSSQ